MDAEALAAQREAKKAAQIKAREEKKAKAAAKKEQQEKWKQQHVPLH